MTPEAPNAVEQSAVPQTPELLRNHEAFISAFIARVVAGSQPYMQQFVDHNVRVEHRKADVTRLAAHTAFNRITTFAQLSEHMAVPKTTDSRNGLGRRVYHAVSSLDCGPLTISPRVMEKYERWMGKTFGEDRVKRYKLEVEREKASNV